MYMDYLKKKFLDMFEQNYTHSLFIMGINHNIISISMQIIQKSTHLNLINENVLVIMNSGTVHY